MRLIDADALITVYQLYLALLKEEGTTYVDISWEEEIMSDIKTISKAPTVDAIPVVRCKDCIHYYADPWGYGNCVFEGGVSRRTKESDFCSWGKRREDGERMDSER